MKQLESVYKGQNKYSDEELLRQEIYQLGISSNGPGNVHALIEI
jgi:hypothetical protein